ncbi:MAG TPA: hypothetical protein VGD34_11175 [Kribbella sp.]
MIVVDAANVVGSRPDGWWRDRAGAARKLLAKLSKLNEKLPEPAEVVVVLEGAARPAVEVAGRSGAESNRSDGQVDLGDLQVVLAGGSGDDAIVEVVRAAVAADSDRQITVVTADRGLRERVEAHGAATVGPRWLWDHLDS